jgi:hypothetical protein
MRFACRVTKARTRALVIFITYCLSTIKIVTGKEDSVRLYLRCPSCSSLHHFVLSAADCGTELSVLLKYFFTILLYIGFSFSFSSNIFKEYLCVAPLFMIFVCVRACAFLLEVVSSVISALNFGDYRNLMPLI